MFSPELSHIHRSVILRFYSIILTHNQLRWLHLLNQSRIFEYNSNVIYSLPARIGSHSCNSSNNPSCVRIDPIWLIRCFGKILIKISYTIDIQHLQRPISRYTKLFQRIIIFPHLCNRQRSDFLLFMFRMKTENRLFPSSRHSSRSISYYLAASTCESIPVFKWILRSLWNSSLVSWDSS